MISRMNSLSWKEATFCRKVERSISVQVFKWNSFEGSCVGSGGGLGWV